MNRHSHRPAVPEAEGRRRSVIAYKRATGPWICAKLSKNALRIVVSGGAGRARRPEKEDAMRVLIGVSAAAAVLALLSMGGSGEISTAHAQTCGHAPKCAGLTGARLDTCMGQRANAEADCQRRGLGDARGNAGPGPKYRKCKDTAAKYGVDSATTTFEDDC